MVNVLRHDPGAFGLVSGVGMHMTKHAFDLYSTTPPESVGALGAPAAVARAVPEPRCIRATHDGAARVTAYSVVHARSGEPEWGLAICDLPGGTDRTYARIDEPALLDQMEAFEWVGAPVQIAAGADGVNRLREGS
jgi:acetyl-CoA C-acetyltransferase